MNDWHVPDDALERYARRPERLDLPTASSVEQHLIGCASCRSGVASLADIDQQMASWSAIADVIDQPRPSVLERLLTAMGTSGGTARLVAATPGLRWAWLGGVILAAGGAALLAASDESPGAFLAMAPLVPLLAVLLAFAPFGDPAGETGVATATFGAALMLRRVATVVVPAIGVLVAVSILVPEIETESPVWLLPGLALATGALAISTWVRLSLAATGIAASWCVLVITASVDRGGEFADSFLFRTPGQVVFLGAFVAAGVIAGLRREQFSTMEVKW